MISAIATLVKCHILKAANGFCRFICHNQYISFQAASNLNNEATVTYSWEENHNNVITSNGIDPSKKITYKEYLARSMVQCVRHFLNKVGDCIPDTNTHQNIDKTVYHKSCKGNFDYTAFTQGLCIGSAIFLSLYFVSLLIRQSYSLYKPNPLNGSTENLENAYVELSYPLQKRSCNQREQVEVLYENLVNTRINMCNLNPGINNSMQL